MPRDRFRPSVSLSWSYRPSSVKDGMHNVMGFPDSPSRLTAMMLPDVLPVFDSTIAPICRPVPSLDMLLA